MPYLMRHAAHLTGRMTDGTTIVYPRLVSVSGGSTRRICGISVWLLGWDGMNPFSGVFGSGERWDGPANVEEWGR
uniref:Uncharacterized protein n=1 Tax=Oryza sativa subsp. japonica TaxID=39947 RepID=Q2R4T0_ORYSJ|nr:hypothetical protein LOC_Os11g27420 [Oryza sativa Japonica Group]